MLCAAIVTSKCKCCCSVPAPSCPFPRSSQRLIQHLMVVRSVGKLIPVLAPLALLLCNPGSPSTLFAYRKSCRNKCLLSLFYRSFRLFCSCSAHRPCEVNNFPFHFPERSKPKTSTFTNKPTRSGRSLNLPRTFLRLTMRPSQCVRPSVSLCPGPSTTFGT